MKAARDAFERTQLSLTTLEELQHTTMEQVNGELDLMHEEIEGGHCCCEGEAGEELLDQAGSLPVSELLVGVVQAVSSSGQSSGRLTLVQEEWDEEAEEAEAAVLHDEEAAQAEEARIAEFQAQERENEAIAHCIRYPLRMPSPESPGPIGTPSPTLSDLAEERAAEL